MALELVSSDNMKKGYSDSETEQFSTFSIAGCMYGIDVIRVQEIVKPMPMTPVPLAPHFVKGLINLRGQVATAIGLRELFGLEASSQDNAMNVVCKIDDSLISLHVDDIGDVKEFNRSLSEHLPKTIPAAIGQFATSVYKERDSIMTVLDIDKVYEFVNNKSENK